MLRRILILGAVVGLLAMAALATLPWWWGPVLRMAAARQGVLVGAYSVEGYGRWAIMEVEVSRPDWEVRIGRIEAPHPLLWLWHRRAAAGVVVEDWTVTIHDADADNEPWPTRSEVLAMVEPTLSWLPAVRAGTGGITWQGETVAVKGASYANGRVLVERVDYRRLTGQLELTRSDDAAWALSLTDLDGTWRGRADVSDDLRQTRITGNWRGHAFDALPGHFGAA